MGERAECPACKAYSSSTLSDLNNGRDCQFCGCPYQMLQDWFHMQPAIEALKESKIKKELIKLLDELHEENAKLKTKIHKIYDLLAWRDMEELFGPILKVKRILNDEDDKE